MAVEKFGAPERLACKILGQNRSAFRKKKPDMGFEEAALRAALRVGGGARPAGTCAPSRPGPGGGCEWEAGAPALA